MDSAPGRAAASILTLVLLTGAFPQEVAAQLARVTVGKVGPMPVTPAGTASADGVSALSSPVGGAFLSDSPLAVLAAPSVPAAFPEVPAQAALVPLKLVTTTDSATPRSSEMGPPTISKSGPALLASFAADLQAGVAGAGKITAAQGTLEQAYSGAKLRKDGVVDFHAADMISGPVLVSLLGLGTSGPAGAVTEVPAQALTEAATFLRDPADITSIDEVAPPAVLARRTYVSFVRQWALDIYTNVVASLAENFKTNGYGGGLYRDADRKNYYYGMIMSAVLFGAGVVWLGPVNSALVDYLRTNPHEDSIKILTRLLSNHGLDFFSPIATVSFIYGLLLMLRGPGLKFKFSWKMVLGSWLIFSFMFEVLDPAMGDGGRPSPYYMRGMTADWLDVISNLLGFISAKHIFGSFLNFLSRHRFHP